MLVVLGRYAPAFPFPACPKRMAPPRRGAKERSMYYESMTLGKLTNAAETACSDLDEVILELDERAQRIEACSLPLRRLRGLSDEIYACLFKVLGELDRPGA
jgi:hypothetical protein